MTHDYPLTPETAATLADFLKAANAHHRGEQTKDHVRELWRVNGWGQCIPAALAKEVMNG